MTGVGQGFGARLAAARAARGPLCVGIDPHPSLLAAWGLDDDAGGLARFCDVVVDALAGTVAALKPQSAFFERHGSAGIAVLERVLHRAREAGALTVLDVKRGDIGSTMSAYADAYCRDGAPLAADAITVSPFLGVGSWEPAARVARDHGRGLFVLALTSNPDGPQVQHAVGADGRSVAAAVVDAATRLNDELGRTGVDEPGDVGLVVGATVGDAAARLGIDLAGCGGPLLVPGLGAQGASAQDVARVAPGASHLVLPTTSRDVLRHGPDPATLADAAARVAADCARALT